MTNIFPRNSKGKNKRKLIHIETDRGRIRLAPIESDLTRSKLDQDNNETIFKRTEEIE